MITQKTSFNKDEYDKLFQDALDDLMKQAGDSAYELKPQLTQETYQAGIYYIKNKITGKYDISFAEYNADEDYYECKFPAAISTLPEYFYYLKELSKINTKYLVLPLDEPHFFIDANTRKIDVPKEFTANGISVQGDHGAEIVYFKINRFFDFTDFGSPDAHIIIQWETADKQTGSTIAIYKDITSDPDFLIFGWELDKNITKAGTVKFSIRILTWKDDNRTEYDYSFSTLPAAVSILPTLQLEGEFLTPSTDVETNILNRIKASPDPIFASKLSIPSFIYPQNIEKEEIIDLNKNQQTGQYEYTLKACAYPTPQGYVEYSWLQNDAQMMIGNNKPNGEDVLLEKVEDWNENITYYIEENGKKIVYPIDEKTDIQVDDNGQITPPLFYKEGQKVITMAGRYNVIAQSRGVYAQSDKVKNLYTWVVPGPDELILIGAEEEIINCEIDNENNYIFNIDNIQENIQNYLNYHKFNTVWSLKDNELTNYENQTSVQIIIDKDAPTEDKYAQQGKYEVAIKGVKNNAETKNELVKTYIVLLPPQNFSASLIKDNNLIKVSTTLTPEDGTSYQLANYTDISYEWYFSKNNEDYTLLENANLNYYEPKDSTDSGYYRCKVLNKYGNKTQSVDTDSMMIIL